MSLSLNQSACFLKVISPKTIPWFVSDVTPCDFKQTFVSLLDQKFFRDASDSPKSESEKHLTIMVNRWKQYLEEGIFTLSVPPDTRFGENTGDRADFWISPYPYWNMKKLAPGLFEFLKASDLVIFKVRFQHLSLTVSVANPFCSRAI